MVCSQTLKLLQVAGAGIAEVDQTNHDIPATQADAGVASEVGDAYLPTRCRKRIPFLTQGLSKPDDALS